MPSVSTETALALVLAATALADDAPPRFTDVTAASGVEFRHTAGASADKFMPETMGSGVCLLDADGDGRLDIYLVDGGRAQDDRFAPGPGDRLYRNLGGMKFEDVTGRSGLGDRSYGMGCTAGDIDRDGDTDLFVTNFGRDTLWRNDGSGRFTEIAVAAGVASELWSVSAAFGDVDGDGDLDLYVSRYVDFGFDNHKYCGDLGRKLRAYCHPDVYDGLPHSLYRNRGDGRFEEVAAEAGIRTDAGKGLGVILSDLDGDGDVDVYAANDSTINFLFRNRGDGRFDDVSLLSGAGFNGAGAAEAGMGVDAGDADGDGHIDLFVTNLDLETNTLYRATGRGRYRDVTVEAGLAVPSLLRVGFGTGFVDADADGDLDLFVVNGHILDNVAEFRDNVTWRQASQLFLNDGRGRFTDVSADAGPFFASAIVGRGLALGDLDGDGDVDAVATENRGPAHILRNDTEGGLALLVELRGRRSNRDGYGARVVFARGERRLVRECRSASSYLSQGDPRVHFGLGDDPAPGRLTVHWPSGEVDTVEKAAAGLLVVLEGEGVTERTDHSRSE